MKPRWVKTFALWTGCLCLVSPPAQAQFKEFAQIGRNAVGSMITNSPGAYTVVGAGNDAWDNMDECSFAYQEVTGDFDVRVRLTSLQRNARWTKAGLMVRESLAEDSRMAFNRVTPSAGATCTGETGANEVRFAYRTGQHEPGGFSGDDHNGGRHEDIDPGNPLQFPPYPNAWLRLVREGSSITAYNSSDGVSWLVLGSQETYSWSGGPFNPTVLLGLAVSRHGNGGATCLTASAQFSNYQLLLGSPAPFQLLGASTRGNPTGLRLEFNHPVSATAFDTNNYFMFGPGVIAAARGPNSNTVQLTLAYPMSDGDGFLLQVSSAVTDLSGNFLQNGYRSFRHGEGYEARLLHLLHNMIPGTNVDLFLTSTAYRLGLPVACQDRPAIEGNYYFEDLVPNGVYNENYSSRLFGVLQVPFDGFYRFACTSDDTGRLFFSTNESPAQKVEIAREPAWNQPYGFGNCDHRNCLSPENQSGPQFLLAGRRYYLEFSYAEGGDGNHGAVTWDGGTGTPFFDGMAPLDQNQFVPSRFHRGSVFFSLGPVLVTQPPHSQSAAAGQTATFAVLCDGTPPWNFQWRSNGVAIAGARAQSYTTPALTLSANGAVYSVVVSNEFSQTISPGAVLSVRLQYSRAVVAGFNAIANQLDHGGNTLNEVLPSVPPGTYLYKWNESRQNFDDPALFDEVFGWLPNLTLQPGEGAVFQSDVPFTLTFTGTPHIPVLPIALPHGVQRFLSRQTNDVGTYENIIGTPPEEGAQVYRFNPITQTWDTNRFTQGAWTPAPPAADVGEALMFFIPAGLPPAITGQPQSATVVNCQSATLLVQASGTDPLRSQWRFNNLALAGATNNLLTILNAQLANQGDYTVVVSNSFGVVTSQVAHLTVTDLAPTIACAADVTVPANPGTCTASGVSLGTPTATDECGPVSVTSNAPSVFPLGVTMVSWTASDQRGLTASCFQRVTVVDTNPPTITSVPSSQTVSANANCQGAIPDLTGGLSVSDNCGSVTVAQTPVPGTLVGLGTTVVQFTVRDGAGNTNLAQTTITVVDTTRATITSVPSNQTLSANASCQAAIPDLTGGVSADDNCGPMTVTQTPVAGTLAGLGVTEVIFRVTDAFGNASTGRTMVTVADTTPPYLPSCPGPPVYVENGDRDSFQGPSPTQPRPTLAALVSGPSRMFDEFGASRPFIHSFSDLPECVADGTLTIHVRGDVGTSQDDTITVGFTDATGFNPATSWTLSFGPGPHGPGLTPQPWIPGAELELTLDLGRLPAAEGGSVDLLPELAKNRFLDLLITDSTAVDFVALNYKTCSAGPDIVVPNLPGQPGAVVTFPLPEFVDACDATPTVTARPASGSFFPLGRTLVFFLAEDDAGNIGRAKRWVDVPDVEPPTLQCSNLVLECVKPGGTPVFFNPHAQDNSGFVEVQCVPPSGSLFPIGTTPVTCIAMDRSGKSSQCTFTVTLESRFPVSIHQMRLGFGAFTLTFPTQPGVTYVVESADQLVGGGWQLLTTVPGDGGLAAVTDPLTTRSSRFYRVRLQAELIEGGLLSVFEPPEPPPAQPGSAETDRPGCGPPHVYLFSGEFHHAVTDLRIPGRGLDFVWARKYRSCVCFVTPMGWGWDYSYNICIARNGPNIDLLDGNTRQDTYFQQSDGTFTANEFFREGRFGTNGQFALTFADQGTWEFLPLDGSPAQGRITRIADRHGNALRFAYDWAGRLTNVIDTLDRPIEIAYDADGFFTAVTDFTGRQVRYTHYQDGETNGSFGDLRSVISPVVIDLVNGNDFVGGKTNVYTYAIGSAPGCERHLLLTLTDAKGQTWLQNTYAPRTSDAYCNRVIRQVWGYTNEVLRYHYVRQTPAPENNFAVTKAIVNDRVGNVGECYFDRGNRPVLHRAFTGRAVPDQPTTDTQNRPRNKLRSGDPEFFETRYTWNVDSLPVRIVYPNGNSTENVHERDLNPAAAPRARGNLRLCRKLPGPLGGDQAVLEEFFDYADGFGGCGQDFVTRHTDARGHVTLHFYDARGNRRHTQHRLPHITEDFEYNEFGQSIAHTLPDNGSGHRRRDEFAYYASGPQRGYRAQEIVDAGGLHLTTSYEYDAVGNVIRAVDPRGHDTLYLLNSLNQLLRETSREVTDGSGIRYRRDVYYDANNNVVRIDVENRDESGVLQTNIAFSEIFDYDILNFPIRVAREKRIADLPNGVLSYDAIPFRLRPEFIVNEYTYDANRNQTLVRYGEATAGFDPFNLVALEYDERDLLFRKIQAAGGPLQSTAQFDYDANNNLVRQSQGLEDAPRVTTHAYDGFNRERSQTDPMGNVTTFHYDANGHRVSERLDGEMQDLPGNAGNRRLSETRQTFDAMNRLVQTDRAFFDPQSQQSIDDGFATTWLVYNDNSQMVRLVDDRTNSTTVLYDTANRTNTIVDALTNRVSFEYDANGNVLVIRSLELSGAGNPPHESATTNRYDGLDRLVESVDSAGQTNRQAYDSRNNPVVSTDARGNVTRQEYDGLSRLIETRRFLTDTGYGSGNPSGAVVTRQDWDDSCRPIAQTDANQHTTRYAYDALNRRIATRMADGTLHLTGAGALAWPDGQPRPAPDEFFSNGYDVHGNPVVTTDANGTVVVTVFDLLDRPAQRYIERAAGVLGATFEVFRHDGRSLLVLAQTDDSRVARAYDSLGHLIRETINFSPPGFPPAADRLTSWTCDALGNPTACAYPGGRILGRRFDALNRAEYVCNGLCADPPAPATLLAQAQYLGPARLETIRYGNGTTALFAYDAAGRPFMVTHSNLISGEILDRRFFGWEPGSNRTLRRDLTPGSRGLTQAYIYDSVSRLVRAQVNAADGALLRQTIYTLDGVGNRTHVNTDPAPGNYTLDATLPEPADAQVNQYTATPYDTGRSYDANGNLRLVAGPAALTNRYDYRNRLVETRPPGAAPVAYTYDALGRKVSMSAAASTRRFFYDGQSLIEEQDATQNTVATYVPGVSHDRPLSFRRGLADFFLHADDLGNVGALSDAAGVVTEHYDYEDFGEPTIAVQVQSAHNAGGYPSDTDAGQMVAEDFSVPLGATVDGVRWWGFYTGGPAPATDNFVLGIYADSAGHPGALLQQTAVGNAVLRTATGRALPAGAAEYVYEAALATPIGLQPGLTYWLLVQNNTSGSAANWNLEMSAHGNARLATSSNGGATWGSSATNAAFALIARASVVGNPHLFLGERYEPETGYVQIGSRRYDPTLGRFIERDPQGSWSDALNLGNAYTLRGNNPWRLPTSTRNISAAPSAIGDLPSQIRPRVAPLGPVGNLEL